MPSSDENVCAKCRSKAAEAQLGYPPQLRARFALGDDPSCRDRVTTRLEPLPGAKQVMSGRGPRRRGLQPQQCDPRSTHCHIPRVSKQIFPSSRDLFRERKAL
jgi:hypothetical protein